MLKRLLSCVLCCCILLTTTGISSRAQVSSVKLKGYLLASENLSYALFYKQNAASIALMDKTNGHVWYSQLPESQYPSQKITGAIQAEFNSMLIVTYTLLNKTQSTKTTVPLEQLGPKVKTSAIKDGVEYTLTIESLNLAFRVDITIDTSGMTVSIPDSGISEGTGVGEQIEAKKSGIIQFIDSTVKSCGDMQQDGTIPSNIRKSLKSAVASLNNLKKAVNAIDGAVGIEAVSDSLLKSLNSLQDILEGSLSSPGFFAKIQTSTQIGDETKTKYAGLQSDFDDSIMPVKITVSSLKTINVGSLVEIEVLPYFGAAGDNAEGYMVYPNGCGAVTKFKAKHGTYSSNYKCTVYSDDEPDIDWEKSIDSAGLQRTLVPYYGVKQGDSAFVAYVASGGSESSVSFSPSGYIVNVNRISSCFVYRRSVSIQNSGGTWQSGVALTSYELQRNKVNAYVKYMFLNGASANYSGMAVKLCDYLQSTGVLHKDPILSKGVPLAISLLGGYNQKVLVFNNYITATTFEQARRIVETITGGKKIPLLVNYSGYTSDGYGVYPASNSASGKLGGLTGLKELAGTVAAKGGRLFLQDNPVEALYNAGGYTEGDLALSTSYRIFHSKDNTTYLLSPEKALGNFENGFLPFLKRTGAYGATLDRIGSFLYYDYSKKHKSSREETIATWQQMLKLSAESAGGVAVTGGNEYTFPYAGWIMNVPTSTSGYVYTDYAIPFYQMLIHGFIPYTSEPVNCYYDKQLQFLQSVEYGNLPYYSLTYNSINTNDMDQYTSVFSVYYDDIIDTYNSYTKDLRGIADKQMTGHSRKGDLVTVDYSDGTRVYINYGGKKATVDGVAVGAMNYAVSKPVGGETIEKTQEKSAEEGKSGGIHLYRSLAYWILLLFLVSLALFLAARFLDSKGHGHV